MLLEVDSVVVSDRMFVLGAKDFTSSRASFFGGTDADASVRWRDAFVLGLGLGLGLGVCCGVVMPSNSHLNSQAVVSFQD